MTERPILFSAPMVRAILDGRKTQTRRVVLGRGTRGLPEFHGGAGQKNDPTAWGWFFDGPDHHGYEVLARGLDERFDNGLVSTPCPFGLPGDRLWVRETWCLTHPDYHSEAEGLRLGRPMRSDGRWCHYRATDDVESGDKENASPWRPSRGPAPFRPPRRGASGFFLLNITQTRYV